MKKVKLCIATLLISGFSYSQCPSGQDFHQFPDQKYEDAMKEFKAIEYMVEDIVDAIRMDMYYGHLENQRGNYYIAQILDVKLRNQQVMADLWKARSITLGEYQNKL